MAKSFRDSLEAGFTITAEIPPPKSVSFPKSIEVAKKVAGKVAGLNVTDNQRGMMRMSSMAFSHILLGVGCDPVWQICCRDRNRLALQSDLLGASALGIKNVCVMTGDYPTLGDNPGAKAVYDLDAVQLMKLTDGFSNGKDIRGGVMKNHPDFFVGGVVNPFYEPIELELLKLQKKVNAGAKFFQTQPFFDIESVDTFLEQAKPSGAKMLIGVTPIKSMKMLKFLNENVLTKPIPDGVSKRIEFASDQMMEGLKISAEFINGIRDRVDGAHIMPINQVASLPLLLDMVEEGNGA